MKKRDKIYDSPEYKQIKEHLPEILKEMERDKGLKQYQMPEGWNDDFERIYQAEHRKERILNRILAGACAAIILGIGAVHVGERLELTSMVQADDIEETKENGFEDGEYQYNIYENESEDNDSMMSADEEDMSFTCDSLQDLYDQVKAETKSPIYMITNSLNEYSVKDVFYSKTHKNLSYRLENGNTYLYVIQQMQVDATGNGTINDQKEATVHVEDLNLEADIYRSAQDNSLKCSIVYHNEVLSLVTNMELEEYKDIICNLEYH